MTHPHTLITMSQIAALAEVQRPVVSMWRRRFRNAATPFPEPVERAGSQELFALDQVVDWLESTDHGNNPDVRDTAARRAQRVLTSSLPAERLVEISALLCLRHEWGGPLEVPARDHLTHLAANLWGDDHEHVTIPLMRGPEVFTDLGWVEEAASESFSISDAHEDLVERALRHQSARLGATLLHHRLTTLLERLVATLADGLDPLAAVCDPTGQGAETLLAALPPNRTLFLKRSAGAIALHTRRLLALQDAYVELFDGPPVTTSHPTVYLIALPLADAPNASLAVQLKLIQRTQAAMREQDVALVVAPASLLTDALNGEASQRRDSLLRTGWVRAIVRLPEGLRVNKPREHLALWLLGAPPTGDIAAQYSRIADLGGGVFNEADVDSLVTDLVASLGTRMDAHRRQWAHLVAVARPALLASDSLVRGARRASDYAAPDLADVELRLMAADAHGVLTGYSLEEGATSTAPSLSLGDALERRLLRLISGHRLEVSALPKGNVPVVGVRSDHSVGPTGGRVDRATLLGRTNAHTTQAGDVVFVDGKAPRAWVDRDGGSVVVAPARILRVAPDASLLPDAVAAAINASQPGTRWRAWTVTTVDAASVPALRGALDDLAATEARLDRELTTLRALRTDLLDAVERRHISISRKEPDGSSEEG